MRKRQRKKNQKKFDVWWRQYLKEIEPIIQQSHWELEQRCKWHGHQWRNNQYVGIPDFDGYICICCGKTEPHSDPESLHTALEMRGIL